LIVSLLERLHSVAVQTSVKMKGLSLACLLLLAFVPQVVLGTHDVYIVTMEGDPVVSYRGGVEGFPGTAADLDEEMDITRYSTLLDVLLPCMILQVYPGRFHTVVIFSFQVQFNLIYMLLMVQT
jgi:hypothetical protein